MNGGGWISTREAADRLGLKTTAATIALCRREGIRLKKRARNSIVIWEPALTAWLEEEDLPQEMCGGVTVCSSE